MDIKDCKIDMMVRTKAGKTGKIKEIDRFRVVIDLPDGSDYGAAFNCVEPASDPCECCQKLFSMNESLEYWRKQYSSACRGATYWREELTKLQEEALADSKPLSEVAKCYKQVDPEKLLMSQEARRVQQFLIDEGPTAYRCIAATFGGDWGKTMDGIIELRDAGRIELVDGKYEIVRD